MSEDLVQTLTNKGVGYIEVDQSVTKEQKTLIVLGVARGGTSLLSGSLSKMGVFTGSTSAAPVFEDLKLAQAFENGNLKQAQQVIEDYNSRHDVWAFKRPASVKYLKQLITMCRNPVLLIVFRDIFSIANRNRISMKIGLVPGLQKALSDYGEIVNIVEKRYCDMYFFSYDKVMLNKELLINELCRIASQKCTEEIIQNVSNFIDPNSENYLRNTRINKVIGQIDRCNKRVIAGWAAITHSDIPVELELYINGTKTAQTTADLSRPDVLKAKQHATGTCGYKFELDTENELQENDEVSIIALNHGLKEELQKRVFHHKRPTAL